MIKKGDFVELEFTGRITETGIVFDTTNLETAKENKIFQPQAKYGAIRIVVGETHVVPGLDKALEGKKTGEFKITLSPEDALGKKHSQLLKIIPMKQFRKQNINPFVGLEVNIDGMPGIVRSVSGGRTIVDFNHPLAGKELDYEINVTKIITDDKEKAESVLRLLQVSYKEATVKEKKAIITFSFEVPEQLKEQIEKEMKRLASLKLEIKVAKDEKKKQPENKNKEESEK